MLIISLQNSNFPTVLLLSAGLYMIPGALSISEQQYWIQQSLEVFLEPANRTNHTAQYGAIEGLWAAAQEERTSQKTGADGLLPSSKEKAPSDEIRIGVPCRGGANVGSEQERVVHWQICNSQLKARSGQGSAAYLKESNGDDCISTCQQPVSKDNVSAHYSSHATGERVAEPGSSAASQNTDSNPKPRPSAVKLLRKLRWATLGLQYQWTTRTYDETQPHAPFPADLAHLAARLAAPALRDAATCCGLESALLLGALSETSGCPKSRHCESHPKPELAKCGAGERDQGLGRQEGALSGVAVEMGSEFRAEGAIVNYYGPLDTLSGHLDDIEANMDLPIVSIR
jgi:alkylated DNA repair dioxygenase AlkB